MPVIRTLAIQIHRGNRGGKDPLYSMEDWMKALLWALVLVCAVSAGPKRTLADLPLDQGIEFKQPIRKGEKSPQALRLQVLLDRANFSPGPIDGIVGETTVKALSAYQRAHEIGQTQGVADRETWDALNQNQSGTLTTYTITEADLKGPFVPIPEDIMEMAKLERLGYESVEEALAEKFHTTPETLKRLNPKADFTKAGAAILAPNTALLQPKEVELKQGSAGAPSKTAAKLKIEGSERAVRALDADGKTLAFFPATLGSEHDPLPIGDWEVTGVYQNPKFYYNPELFWDADPAHSKATIAPGPNNPVGVVWIDITKDHFGIHGTPEPMTVGRSQSHGCIRLTNWDAAKLGKLVKKGTPLEIRE